RLYICTRSELVPLSLQRNDSRVFLPIGGPGTGLKTTALYVFVGSPCFSSKSFVSVAFAQRVLAIVDRLSGASLDGSPRCHQCFSISVSYSSKTCTRFGSGPGSTCLTTSRAWVETAPLNTTIKAANRRVIGSPV